MPVAAVGIVFVMVVPVPAFLLDLLLATSIMLSILVLLGALQILRPVQFSVFPTMLLLLTLFRLSLNLASTRRILLHGNEGTAAAGRVIESFGLPERTCAMELDLSVLFAAAESAGPVQAPQLSAYPLAIQDVALIVDAAVPASDVAAALVAGAPADLLEDLRLFDVYTGAQIGEDRKLLAYTLRFRAPDRTLTAAETADARDAAVAEAQRRVGALLRSG